MPKKRWLSSSKPQQTEHCIPERELLTEVPEIAGSFLMFKESLRLGDFFGPLIFVNYHFMLQKNYHKA